MHKRAVSLLSVMTFAGVLTLATGGIALAHDDSQHWHHGCDEYWDGTSHHHHHDLLCLDLRLL